MSVAGGIPEKSLFKIGEVAELVGVKPYVLRYWESEFRLGRPQKSGPRVYQRKDIEVLMEIRRLLYDEKLSIPNVKKQLRTRRPAPASQLPLGFGGGRGEGEAVVVERSEGRGGEMSDAPKASDEPRSVGEGPHHSEAALASAKDAPPAPLAAPPMTEAPARPPKASSEVRLRRLVLDDPTSRALIDQALREAEAILALADGREPMP